MMDYILSLKNILDQLDFSEAAKSEVLLYIEKHFRYISSAADKVYSNDEAADPVMKMNNRTALFVLMFKMVKLKLDYMIHGWPEKVMLDTLSDVALRQRLYFSRHGKLGLNREDRIWLKHIYKLEIFKFGALQYEITHFKKLDWKGLTYKEDVFAKLSEGTPILNLHIRRGVDFSKAAVDLSFQLAEKFFSKYFPEHQFRAYTCNSWMLCPGNEVILDGNSNILDFYRRFEIVAESPDPKMALTYIFRGRYRSKRDYPQDTKLQKSALEHLEQLGVGCGIIMRVSK